MAVTAQERQAYHEQQRRKALCNSLKGHCSIEDNYSFVRFSRFWMTFYTTKAVICLLLRRNERTNRTRCGFVLSVWHWLVNAVLDVLTQTTIYDRTYSDGDNVIAVCMWDYWEGDFEPDNGWKELEVGYGVLQNWHYSIIDNSNY